MFVYGFLPTAEVRRRTLFLSNPVPAGDVCPAEVNYTSGPLFEQAMVEVLELFPDAYAAVRKRIDELWESLWKPKKKGPRRDCDEEDGT